MDAKDQQRYYLGGRTAVCEQDGRIAASGSILCATDRAALLGALACAPQYRRQGLRARRCARAVPCGGGAHAQPAGGAGQAGPVRASGISQRLRHGAAHHGVRDSKCFHKEVQLSAQAKTALRDVFAGLEQTAEANQFRVMRAFADNRVSEGDFAGTTGYGYNDRGRDTLDRVLAACFGCESALVRHNFVSGTHALTVALFALLRPGDLLLSATGKAPTIRSNGSSASRTAAGARSPSSACASGRPAVGRPHGRLRRAGRALQARPKVVYAQRSRGYGEREGLSARSSTNCTPLSSGSLPSYVVVDNCYGEFLETEEPKADLLVGSFIKKSRRGPCGHGRVCRRQRCLRGAGRVPAYEPRHRREMGATLDQTKKMLRGLFYAPHTVFAGAQNGGFRRLYPGTSGL